MTGFSRVTGDNGDTNWLWEIKSLNARGLDIRCKFPNGYDAIELKVRSLVAQRVSRGNITINLNINNRGAGKCIEVNWTALEQLSEVALQLTKKFGARPYSADGLLALRGALEPVPEVTSDNEFAANMIPMLRSFSGGLDDLLTSRSLEGEKLGILILEQIDEMQKLLDKLESIALLTVARVRERLKAQLDVLLSDINFDKDRLEQESVLLAAKADIREELDRLRHHLSSAKTLLTSSESIGRRLDFLAQELNREVNTIMSKSQDIEISRIGIDFKALVDQMREQSQNIE